MTSKDLVDALRKLTPGKDYEYVSGPGRRAAILEIDAPGGPISARRSTPATGKAEPLRISADVLTKLAAAIRPGTPFHVDGVLQGSGNTRSVLEALLANTPAFWVIYRDGRKHLVLLEEQHSLGVISRKETLPPEAQIIEERPARDLNWLVSETLMDREWLTDVIDALEGESPTRQIILAGPPGTGKTLIADRLAKYLTESERQRLLVQLHPTYGYEDFVEGLRPELKDEKLLFEIHLGVIRRVVKRFHDSHQRQVLILDEMNRANLPRVLGELLYVLEYRDAKVDLLYTRDFQLPPEILIIGTMNTADRSIRSIDIALRRRFEVFECPASSTVLTKFFETHDNQVPDLIDGFRRLNTKLESDLDRHHMIGQAFFMADPLTASTLRRIWSRKVFPLLEEYFFDRTITDDYVLETFWPSLNDAPAQAD